MSDDAVLSSFCVNQEDTQRFALLSGDANPMHLDDLASRRLLFGRSVVHGVHILLLALDVWCQGRSKLLALRKMKAQFVGPAFRGEEIVPIVGAKEGSVSLTLECANRIIQQIDFEIEPLSEASSQSEPPELPGPPTSPECADMDFEQARQATGSVPLRFDPGLGHAMFPSLTAVLPLRQMAVILATTQIVGMRCPGLHSLFIGLSLNFPPNPSHEVSYAVRTASRAASMFSIALTGAAEGLLEALMRPKTTHQPTYATVQGLVEARQLRERHVVIIGGSRGLGELSAKLFAAAGAQVFITYHRGRDECQAVIDDICAGGGKAEMTAFDVLADDLDRLGSFVGEMTDILFFASPKILLRPKQAWNDQAFRAYLGYYLDAPVRMIEQFFTRRPGAALRFFYPSTVYLDQPIAGTAEYVAAKGAGEAALRALAARYAGLELSLPRLPRMYSDQTASLSEPPVPLEQTVEYLQRALRIA